MFHHEGCGLSANQIGMNIRAFAMVRDIEYNDVIVCFNPRIVTRGDVCGVKRDVYHFQINL